MSYIAPASLFFTQRDAWSFVVAIIPMWNEKCVTTHKAYLDACTPGIAATKRRQLFYCNDLKKGTCWNKTDKEIYFTHFIRIAWKIFDGLTGCKSPVKRCPITANAITHQLLTNGSFKKID